MKFNKYTSKENRCGRHIDSFHINLHNLELRCNLNAYACDFVMNMALDRVVLALYLISVTCARLQCPQKPKFHLQVLHKWTALDYKFPPYTSSMEMQRRGKFIPENNYLFDIEVYRGEIYVNVERGTRANRFRDANGVPSTLNRVVVHNGRSLLEPFPSLAAQTVGDCNALQSVGTFRMDRSTGLMWVMDEGRINGIAICPAKLVVIHMGSGKLRTQHVFPRDVYDRIRGNIADIAFAKEKGRTRFVFLSELNLAQLIVYDLVTDKSWSFKDKTMQFETRGARIAADNLVIKTDANMRNIVVSPDSKYLYYSPLSGYNLYQIPIKVLKHPDGDFTKSVRLVGEFPQNVHSLITGSHKMYFADFGRNALKAWNVRKDIKKGGGKESCVRIESIENIVRDEEAIQYVRSLSLDGGYMYYVSNNLAAQRLGIIDFTDECVSNFIIGRVFVNDKSPFESDKY